LRLCASYVYKVIKNQLVSLFEKSSDLEYKGEKEEEQFSA
jgi:hypothetical protein